MSFGQKDGADGVQVVTIHVVLFDTVEVFYRGEVYGVVIVRARGEVYLLRGAGGRSVPLHVARPADDVSRVCGLLSSNSNIFRFLLGLAIIWWSILSPAGTASAVSTATTATTAISSSASS